MSIQPQTLIEAVRYFANEDVCQALMQSIKWPDGNVTCPKCGNSSVSPIKNRPAFQCNSRSCKKQFSYKVGTIFEESKLPLGHWFVAIWCIANMKNGISSHELARALGVTQKTAWFVLHRIRLAMETGTFKKFEGEVESDETFIGGKSKNMHAVKREKKITGRGPVNKTAVQGVLERGGEVRTFAACKTDGATLSGNVAKSVDSRATIYTDANPSYERLKRRFQHLTVDHAVEYVRGRVHVNGIENFWSLLKRTLSGTYIHVAPFHLHRYCSEQEFRYNKRRMNDSDRFSELLQRVVGRRLTYRLLAAVGDCGFMGIQ